MHIDEFLCNESGGRPAKKWPERQGKGVILAKYAGHEYALSHRIHRRKRVNKMLLK